MTSNLMLWLIAAPALAAVVVPAVGAILPGWRCPLFSLAHVGGLALALLVLATGPARIVVEVQHGPRAVQFGLVVDHATGFALALTALLLLIVASFSQGYVQGARHGAVFLSLLLLEQAAVNLVLVAGDLLALYGGLLSLSFALMLMIGLDFGVVGGAAALRVFATLEVPAALAFVGFWLIDARAGTLALAALARDAGWLNSASSGVLIVPIVVAIVSRAGLTPLQNWVVAGCRAASVPAAIAIAGVALPVGGLVLARLAGAAIPLGPAWMQGLAILGAATAIVGGIGASREKTALGWLGYLAGGQVGLAVVGFAGGAVSGQVAGWTGLASAALATTLVGMGIGLAIRAARQDRLDALRQLPQIGAARWPFLLGLLALAPLPPLPTFTARRLLLASLLDGGSEWNRLVAAAVVIGTISLAIPVWRVVCDLSAASDVPPLSFREREIPIGPLLLSAMLLAVLGVIPLRQLLEAMGMAVYAPAAVGSLAATILVLLAVGVAPGLGYLALRKHRPERLGQLLAHLSRRLHLDQALDPYVLVGGVLLGMGRLSALTLDQTLGRLARAR